MAEDNKKNSLLSFGKTDTESGVVQDSPPVAEVKEPDWVFVSRYSHDGKRQLVVKEGREDDVDAYGLVSIGSDPNKGEGKLQQPFNWSTKLGKKKVDKQVTIELWKQGFWDAPPSVPAGNRVQTIQLIVNRYQYDLEKVIAAVYSVA